MIRENHVFQIENGRNVPGSWFSFPCSCPCSGSPFLLFHYSQFHVGSIPYSSFPVLHSWFYVPDFLPPVTVLRSLSVLRSRLFPRSSVPGFSVACFWLPVIVSCSLYRFLCSLVPAVLYQLLSALVLCSRCFVIKPKKVGWMKYRKLLESFLISFLKEKYTWWGKCHKRI